jgi:membrane-bound metal-dependent hydrolase YbcI (DUF457 family)
LIKASSNRSADIPFTPFHFGPAVFAKACFPNRYWITPFVLANVLIDCEVLYCLRFSLRPIHRFCHTYIGGTLVGAFAGFVAYAGIKTILMLFPSTWFTNCRNVSSKQLVTDAALSSIVGGISHVFLDSLMHRDMQPFWPIVDGNAFAGIVDVGILHVFLAATGFLGVMLWFMMYEP